MTANISFDESFNLQVNVSNDYEELEQQDDSVTRVISGISAVFDVLIALIGIIANIIANTS